MATAKIKQPETKLVLTLSIEEAVDVRKSLQDDDKDETSGAFWALTEALEDYGVDLD